MDSRIRLLARTEKLSSTSQVLSVKIEITGENGGQNHSSDTRRDRPSPQPHLSEHGSVLISFFGGHMGTMASWYPPFLLCAYITDIVMHTYISSSLIFPLQER